MKITTILYAAFLRDHGFLSRNQEKKSLYWTYTTDITQAKLYKSKMMATRILNYQDINHPDLRFFEVVVETTYPKVQGYS